MRFCDKKECLYTGGGVWLVQAPLIYNGIDCFLLLDDCDVFTIFKNETTADGDAPYYDEYIIKAFDYDEELPKEIKPLADALKKEKATKCNY